MKYKLPIRKLNESDINVTCLEIPEEDDFDMYFSALKEDIQNIEIVVSIAHEAEIFIIEIKEESEFNILYTTVKDMLQNQYKCKLTTSSGFAKIQ